MWFSITVVTTNTKKTQHVHMSPELSEIKDQCLLVADLRVKTDVAGELVVPSPDGSVHDSDSLGQRSFQPVSMNN